MMYPRVDDYSIHVLPAFIWFLYYHQLRVGNLAGFWRATILHFMLSHKQIIH